MILKLRNYAFYTLLQVLFLSLWQIMSLCNLNAVTCQQMKAADYTIWLSYTTESQKTIPETVAVGIWLVFSTRICIEATYLFFIITIILSVSFVSCDFKELPDSIYGVAFVPVAVWWHHTAHLTSTENVAYFFQHLL